MILEKDQKDAWVETLTRRVQGEDIEFSIPLKKIDQAQLESIAQEAVKQVKTTDVDNPQNAVWEVIGREAAESVDHDEIAREAAEGIDYDAIAREATEKIDHDAIARRASEALTTNRETINHHRTAIYKTQLQRGGRVSVPDAEIKTLGLEPGDTLQIRLTRLEPVNGE